MNIQEISAKTIKIGNKKNSKLRIKRKFCSIKSSIKQHLQFAYPEISFQLRFYFITYYDI